MSKVQPKLVINITLSVNEAEALVATLRALPEDHPTDALYHQLDDVLDDIPEGLRGDE